MGASLYCRLKGGKPVLTRADVLKVPELSMNPLIDVILSLFDPEATDRITFLSFVEVLSVFHERAPEESKLRLAFSVYDTDRNGYITRENLKNILRLMVGANLSDDQLDQILVNTCYEVFGAEPGPDNDALHISYDAFADAVAASATGVSTNMTINFG
ncbi:calcineurin Ca2+-binding regulatory subunit CnaB [Thecamonas trahens ATCC 50062]|uniref:Calcineurin Ca2+-binding regulatory subunit CnaB n=1 Tax=Thecamonas trahens ATCC 50062 TaxID=461836 RepID=A0A0L0DGV4_THETB|nr:calcineurin Ca2+-binding regulatory subunit CnaB [Thecamonas trahens ATCC 50062]KNC51351.1 calcineurin Ca2+-binding regulatory subunit CnaB [Thecamonas trahens ATCC 50062]|eukprot:XP_013756271.1 calcineurin Ca2+-binding regulatory subunit CnaB [Thecamonas trahens ATCC 50062]